MERIIEREGEEKNEEKMGRLVYKKKRYNKSNGTV